MVLRNKSPPSSRLRNRLLPDLLTKSPSQPAPSPCWSLSRRGASNGEKPTRRLAGPVLPFLVPPGHTAEPAKQESGDRRESPAFPTSARRKTRFFTKSLGGGERLEGLRPLPRPAGARARRSPLTACQASSMSAGDPPALTPPRTGFGAAPTPRGRHAKAPAVHGPA